MRYIAGARTNFIINVRAYTKNFIPQDSFCATRRTKNYAARNYQDKCTGNSKGKPIIMPLADKINPFLVRYYYAKNVF